MRALLYRLRDAPWLTKFGLAIFVLAILIAVLAPLLAPYGESEIVGGSFEPWSARFWLGTDALGRDMLSRMIYGARNTIGIAMLATLLACLLGCLTGLVAAAVGGIGDLVLSRIVDILMSIPQLIFALLALTILGTSTVTLVVVIAVLDATRFFRVARAAAGNIVALDYVEAARIRGEGLGWVISREILPNIAAPLATELGARFSFVFLFISSLSFLGLGIQPPLADWGSMVRESAALLTFGDITPLIPAAAIALLSISVNFIVDWGIANRASAPQ